MAAMGGGDAVAQVGAGGCCDCWLVVEGGGDGVEEEVGHFEQGVVFEGEAGGGKTELAKVLAQTAAYQLIRLQCYEGLDEAKALYEWEYSKQLLYVQMLKDKFGTLLAETTSLNEAVSLLQQHTSAFFSQHFLLPRPLLQSHDLACRMNGSRYSGQDRSAHV